MSTKPSRAIKRSALALIALTPAALASAAIAPPMASAASTCSFSQTFRNVSVSTDTSQPVELVLKRSGQHIAVLDGAFGIPALCPESNGTLATVNNADKITVLGVPDKGIVVDMSEGAFTPGFTPEPGATPEMEIRIVGSTGKQLGIKGTNGADTVRIGGRGEVMFGNDAGIDIRVSGSAGPFSRVHGLLQAGNDFVTGRGVAGQLAATAVPLAFDGGDGQDTLVDGFNPGSSSFGSDSLGGGSGDDTLFTVDGLRDRGSGGPGFDVATVDAIDSVLVDQTTVAGAVGKLRLTPAKVSARAGKLAHLRMSWTHPQTWTQLRTVKLDFNQGADVKGTLSIRPSDGRMRGEGAVKVIAGRSKLTHHGKTVTARLALRLDPSLAGQDLRLDVQAADRNGHTQTEPDAGLLHVAK